MNVVKKYIWSLFAFIVVTISTLAFNTTVHAETIPYEPIVDLSKPENRELRLLVESYVDRYVYNGEYLNYCVLISRRSNTCQIFMFNTANKNQGTLELINQTSDGSFTLWVGNHLSFASFTPIKRIRISLADLSILGEADYTNTNYMTFNPETYTVVLNEMCYYNLDLFVNGIGTYSPNLLPTYIWDIPTPDDVEIDIYDKPSYTLPDIPQAPTSFNVLEWLKYIVDWIKYLGTYIIVNIKGLFQPMIDKVVDISAKIALLVTAFFRGDLSIWDLLKSIFDIVTNPMQYFIQPLVDKLSPILSGLGGGFTSNPLTELTDLFNQKFTFVHTLQDLYKELYSTLVTNAYTQAPSITFDFSEVQGLLKIPSFDVTLNWFLRFKPYTDTVISVWLVVNYIKGLFFGLPNIINGVSSDVKGVS